MYKKNSLLGAHVSIEGGLYKAIFRGEEIGATCIQIFTKSNRQWHAKPITDKESDVFKEEQKKSTVKIVVAHASYLINLGSSTALTIEKSINALADELNRCQQLSIPYLILHPGTMQETDEISSLTFIAENIDKAFEKTESTTVMLLLETMAGQGSSAGYKFQQLATIIKESKHKKRIGVCFDTCHAFAAGYSFDSAQSYKKMWEDFDKTIGIEKLKAFHINDSKKDFGSNIDRHEHIGKGKIAQEAFKFIVNDKRFLDIPKILETPQDDAVADNKRNLEIIRSYLQ